jgi:Nif-specific regulatory protein
MHARLTIQSGHGAPDHCDLFPDRRVNLGRNHDNTIVLYNEHVSRFHATIFHDGGRWLIRDLNTRNGTRVNGALINGEAVLEGDREITIGDVRLRFQIEPLADVTVTPVQPAKVERDPTPPLPVDRDPTVLQRDELNALYLFMAESAAESDPRALIRRALEAVMCQTDASLAGFLSLDPDGPVPRLVLPESAKVDFQLSRQLTRRVERDGRSVWLQTHDRNGAPDESDSLVAYTDALCVPLPTEEAPLGALHAYQVGDYFTERDLRFCEILAGHLASSLRLLRRERTLEADVSRLRTHTPVTDEIIGDSPALRQLRQRIARAAQAPSTVLIHGESGSGKELVARAIHLQSRRRKGPLVAVNCAAITPNLLEAELFGYRKGAFTGADRDHRGLFEQADLGTLFLDEVGELSQEFQAKLLRVIEDKGFRPVGGTAEVHPDVRVVAATHRDLEREVRAERFREDLYYRLNILTLRLPPLRDHAEDIPRLVEFFLKKVAVEWHRRVRVTDEALRRLQEYSWPGNVRQLRAVLESAVALSDRDVLEAEDFPLTCDTGRDAPPASLKLSDVETWAIRQALRRTDGNVTQAAQTLGITRDTLQKKMRRAGIDKWDLD